MPHSVLTRGRKIVARLTALAMVASIMVIGALPASAAIDTSATCPSSTPSAGFVDIAAYSADTQLAINCLVDYGISVGTSATTYSPAMDVSRWQMALFLTRQAEVHGLTLGDGSSQGFTDIAAYPAPTQEAINQLAQLNITKGTTATTYSPAAPVTRWQMALFLTRLLDAAGYTLGDGSSQGFTDIGDYPAPTQTAINQIAQANVSEGFTATTFGPGQNTLRSQMALFLTRTLAADGITPATDGFIITAVSGSMVSYADTNQNKVVTVEVKSTDTFMVDGAAATQGAFLAAATVGDLLTLGGSVDYSLTNRVASDYTSGVVDDVTSGTSLDIIEPISGTVLRNDFATNGTYQLYTVDGASVSLTGFNNSLNAGDTIVITGAGTVSSIQTLALTNVTVTGAASNVTGTTPATTFELGVFADTFAASSGDALTVDGASATEAEFENSLTDGDSITYSKTGSGVTIALTNQASAALSGKVLDNNDIALNTVDIDGVTGPQAYNDTGTVFIVNGSLDSETGFEGALTAGDTISIVRADGEVNTVDRVTLTDGAFSGTPETNVPNTSITVLFTTNGDESEPVVYANAAGAADVGLTGSTITWRINGSTATVGQFSTALDSIIGGAFSGTVSVSLSGSQVVWSVSTSS